MDISRLHSLTGGRAPSLNGAAPAPKIPPPPLPVELVSVEEASSIASVESAAGASPRFCRNCGQPRLAEGECPHCTAAIVQLSQRDVIGLQVEEEQGAIKSAIALYFALLGVCAIGLICSMVSPKSKDLNIQLGETVGITLVTLGWCIGSWRGVTDALRRFGTAWAYPAAIVMGLITFGVAQGVITSAQHWMRVPAERMSDPFHVAGYGMGMVVLCTCVQPAVIEELAFRGVIFNALAKALSPVETVLVSALMFMILHLSVLRFPHTLALGLAAGLLRTRTKSLYPCMLLHFFHNSLCVIAEAASH